MTDRSFDNALARGAIVFLSRVIARVETPLSAQIRFGDSWQEEYCPSRIDTFQSPLRELAEKFLGLDSTVLEDPQRCQTLVDAAEFALVQMTPRQREVIRDRFGLRPNFPRTKTLTQIGKDMGLPRKRIIQLESEGVRTVSKKNILNEIYSMITEV